MGSSKPLPKASYWRAVSYMVKSYVGSGVMSMPLAFGQSGFGVGLFILVMLMVIVTWNLRSMLLCKRHLAKDGVQSYGDLAFVTLGAQGRTLVNSLINANQFLVCAIYFDFVAENVSAILPEGATAAGLRPCIAYMFPIFALLALLPSVDAIAKYTGLANFLIFFVLGVVVVFALSEVASDGIGEGTVLGRPTQWPLFFATAVYSFEGVTNFFPVENSLRDPSQIFSVLYVSMAIVGVTFCCAGGLSYLAWPFVTKGSITAQLSEDHPGSALWTLCAVMASVSVVLTFPVQLFPMIETLELRLGLSPAGKERRRVVVAPRGFGEVQSGSHDDQDQDQDQSCRGGRAANAVSPTVVRTVVAVVKSPLQTSAQEEEAVSFKEAAAAQQQKLQKGRGAGTGEGGGGGGGGGDEVDGGDGDDNVPLEDVNLHDLDSCTPERSPSPTEQSLEQGGEAALAGRGGRGTGNGRNEGPTTGGADCKNGEEAKASAEIAVATLTQQQKGFRVGVVAATGLTAALVPNLGALIALAGAITGPFLAVILPALIDFKCAREEKGVSLGREREKQLDVFLVCLGAVCGSWSFVLAVQLVLRGEGVEG